MKKNKLVKRLVTFVMATIMMFGTSLSAFAAENVTSNTADEYVISEGVSTYSNTSAWVIGLGSQQSGSDIAHLDSYIGLSKTFTVSLEGSVGSGTVSVYIKRVSDGEIVGSWGLTSSQTTKSTTFTLPKSGDYKMVVYNGTNSSVTVYGRWS